MFEPEKIRFNFIDILGAPRRALKGKKIWIHLFGLVIGYAIFTILAYVALAIDGLSLGDAWNRFGIYPLFACKTGAISTLPGWIVYYVGLVIWLLITLIAATIVARITYRELKGDPFYSSSDGMRFIKKHWHAVVFSPFSIIIIIAFFIVMALVMALIGKIPYVGPLSFVLLYPLYFIGSIFTIYTAIVLVVTILYLPAIVGLWEDDTMGSVFQGYSITWSQPWRIVVYSSLICLLTSIGAVLFGWAITAGYEFINIVFGTDWLMGTNLGHIVAWAEQIVFPGYASYDLLCYIPGQPYLLTPIVEGISMSAVSGWEAFIGSILALLLLLIYGSVFAYGLSIITVGQTLSFVIFKKSTDDDNLLERKDEEDLAADAEEEEREDRPEEDEESLDETPEDSSTGGAAEEPADADEEESGVDPEAPEDKDTSG